MNEVLYDRMDLKLRVFIKGALRRARAGGYRSDVVSVRVLDKHLQAQRYRCRWCGGPFECIDHVVARALGGLDLLENLAPCCRECNSLKGNLTLDAWRPIAAERLRERLERRGGPLVPDLNPPDGSDATSGQSGPF